MAPKKKIGWDARPKTSLKNIGPGDLFLFLIGDSKYGFGRIISSVSLGHVAEIFDIVLDSPEISHINLCDIKRKGRLIILDSYSLFDRKAEGDWRIVDREESYEPKNVNGFFFTYGDGSGRRKVDVFDNESSVTATEASKLPPYAPFGDLDVKNEIYR